MSGVSTLDVHFTYPTLGLPTRSSPSSQAMSLPLWNACLASSSLVLLVSCDLHPQPPRRSRRLNVVNVKVIAVTSPDVRLSVRRLSGSNPQTSVFLSSPFPLSKHLLTSFKTPRLTRISCLSLASSVTYVLLSGSATRAHLYYPTAHQLFASFRYPGGGIRSYRRYRGRDQCFVEGLQFPHRGLHGECHEVPSSHSLDVSAAYRIAAPRLISVSQYP